MKLRQKLAAALATAMVVTAVPVVTMADSTNKIVKSTMVVEEDTKTSESSLRIKFDDFVEGEAEEFYLTLTNAEWLTADSDENLEIIAAETVNSKKEWTYTVDGGSVTYTRQGSKVMKVVFTPDAALTDAPTVVLPLPVKLTGGTASVAITGEGSTSTITEGSYVFASTGDKAASVTVSSLNSFYDNGELSKIVLKETFVGSLAQDIIVEVELDDTDFEFAKSEVKVTGTYGFSGQEDIEATVYVSEDEESTAYLHITGVEAGKSLGRLEITGLKVKNNEKEIEAGQLLADITLVDEAEGTDLFTGADFAITAASTSFDQTYSNVAVANIVSYGAMITMKDEKAVDIIAGREKEVEFTVSETVDDTFVGGRKIEITLDSEDYTKSYFWIENSEEAIKALISDNTDGIVDVEGIEIEWYKDKAPEAGKAGKANAIIVKLVDDKGINANNNNDEFTVKTTIYVPVSEKEKTDLTLVASMRGVDEFKSAKAVNIINPFEATMETSTLKVGLQDQKLGNIVITEKDKAMFQEGSIFLDIVNGSKEEDGITIEKAGTLTVEGDLKKADFSLVSGDEHKNEITLKRQSKSASTLTISETVVTVDRTVPEGAYDLVLSGDAIDVHGGKLTIKDYIVIGTPNTQDMSAANGLTKGTATFSMDKATYTINGVEKTMTGAAYIQDPGYTMVPVRYVAEAFGVSGQDILFGNGTVTMFAGNRTVQLTNGSNIAVVNGVNITMATSVVIKEGRTYAPIGEIAKILGVSASWDNETKTATFENK